MANSLFAADKRCPPFEPPENGGVVCHLDPLVTSDTHCLLLCNSGMDVVGKTKDLAKCGEKTKWKWTHEKATCIGKMRKIRKITENFIT